MWLWSTHKVISWMPFFRSSLTDKQVINSSQMHLFLSHAYNLYYTSRTFPIQYCIPNYPNTSLSSISLACLYLSIMEAANRTYLHWTFQDKNLHICTVWYHRVVPYGRNWLACNGGVGMGFVFFWGGEGGNVQIDEEGYLGVGMEGERSKIVKSILTALCK